MLFPVLYYALIGDKVILLPMYVPFLDDSTLCGYVIYYVLHSFWCVQSSIGLIGADLLMALLLLHTLPLVEIFELSISEMNDILVHCPAARQSLLLKMQLRNIIQMHKEIFKCVLECYTDFVFKCLSFSYLCDLSSIYRTVFFIEVNADGLTLIFGIFCVLIVILTFCREYRVNNY